MTPNYRVTCSKLERFQEPSQGGDTGFIGPERGDRTIAWAGDVARVAGSTIENRPGGFVEHKKGETSNRPAMGG